MSRKETWAALYLMQLIMTCFQPWSMFLHKFTRCRYSTSVTPMSHRSLSHWSVERSCHVIWSHASPSCGMTANTHTASLMVRKACWDGDSRFESILQPLAALNCWQRAAVNVLSNCGNSGSKGPSHSCSTKTNISKQLSASTDFVDVIASFWVDFFILSMADHCLMLWISDQCVTQVVAKVW